MEAALPPREYVCAGNRMLVNVCEALRPHLSGSANHALDVASAYWRGDARDGPEEMDRVRIALWGELKALQKHGEESPLWLAPRAVVMVTYALDETDVRRRAADFGFVAMVFIGFCEDLGYSEAELDALAGA
jgi:hypothetical protein